MNTRTEIAVLELVALIPEVCKAFYWHSAQRFLT